MYLERHRKDKNCFLQIRRDIQGISAKMLSKELRDLEMNKMVQRSVRNTKPVTVEYAITEHGKTFMPVIKTLIAWGLIHRKTIRSR